MARGSQSKGKTGEIVAAYQLAALGFVMIRKGSNAWRVRRWIRSYMKGKPGLAEVVPEPRQKGEADWRAVEPGSGRSVFAEVKVRDGKLSWSDLKDHQRQCLYDHDRAGGLSLIIWIEGSDCHVLRWPVPGFGHGSPLTKSQARKYGL
jgi:hypothetical protein